MAEIHRSLEKAYRLLQAYMDQLLKIDPTVQTSLVREADGSFLRLFWAFGPCVQSYKSYLGRVICEDGTYLREKYFDTLLVTCLCDTRNHIFPVELAVVELDGLVLYSDAVCYT